jgi:hypothetical protein
MARRGTAADATQFAEALAAARRRITPEEEEEEEEEAGSTPPPASGVGALPAPAHWPCHRCTLINASDARVRAC